MKKHLVLLVFCLSIAVLFGCNEKKEEVIILEDVFIPVDRGGNPLVIEGCCTTGDTCASGQGVTPEYCTETNGTFSRDKKCADVGNACI